MWGASGSDLRTRAREGYARLSATDWMDVEAGKRIVRWGVGYGFSPAGVLDPPRVATDPTDRLGVNEGRMMARVDLFHHDSSLTVAAAAKDLFAARVRTVAAGEPWLSRQLGAAIVAEIRHASTPGLYDTRGYA